jgi:adenylate cyclase
MEQREHLPRKLAAIVYADVAGYSRLTGEDEDATHRRLSQSLDLIAEHVERHSGRVMHYAGDAVLAMFDAVVDALLCAAHVQRAVESRNADVPEERKVQFRIGVNLGDVIEDRGDIYGDGVNVAARLESLAEPGGICISESVHTAVGEKLPLTYEYLGEQEVKNIAKPVKAYRAQTNPEVELPTPAAPVKKRLVSFSLAAAVAIAVVVGGGLLAWLQPWQTKVEAASIERMAFPLPDEPSIAVLPFDNLSGDPEQEHLVDGFTESLITTLSQMPDLFVIARNSTFTYKGKPVKVAQVAEELGVRYVLEGSMQREGDTLRINAQLIDAVAGHHLWAGRYDRDADAMFAVQDEIIREIFTALQAKLVIGELGRALPKGTDNFAAYLKWLEGWRYFKERTKEDQAMARKLVLEAIEMDPGWAMPYTTVVWTHFLDFVNGWSDSRDESQRLAEEFAQKALALDDTYPGVYAALGGVHVLKGELDQAIANQEKAVALGPSRSVYHVILAGSLRKVGRAEEAVALIKRAMRLEPSYQPAYLVNLGDAYTMLGRSEEAIEAYEEYLERRSRGRSAGYVGLAVNHMWLGHEDEARRYASQLLEEEPKFTVSAYKTRLRYKDTAYVTRLLDALRKAGLPENPPLALPDKPSIAVLAFDNLSGDPEQEYFADGLSENIITALSRVNDMFVISRNSSFKYKGKPITVRQVARDLGVHYVLEGSVQRSGDRLRITAQLIDGQTDQHVWAEKYDRKIEDVFALQDEITRKVIAGMGLTLTGGEDFRKYSESTDSFKAFVHVLKGNAYLHVFRKRGMNMLARQEFEKALALDPNYGKALVQLGHTHLADARYRWSESRKESILLAKDYASRAERAGATAFGLRGWSHFLEGEVEAAMAEFRRGLEASPNSASGNALMGLQLMYTGKPEHSIAYYQRAMRLSPMYQDWYPSSLGEAYRLLGRYEEAIASLNAYIERNPEDVRRGRVRLAATLVQAGRENEARAVAKEMLRLEADFTVASYMRSRLYTDPEVKEQLKAALLAAGLPEHPPPTSAVLGAMETASFEVPAQSEAPPRSGRQLDNQLR